jgi:hypothetical protein
LCDTLMFSVRFKKPDNARLDQCDNPVSRGGPHRVTARIRARTWAGTRSGWTILTGLSSRPATPSAAKRSRTASTVGRDTPARNATSFFSRMYSEVPCWHAEEWRDRFFAVTP